jgi:hypothetical protein
MFDTQEMFAHNRQAAFGQQEMNVGHAAMLAVFDGDDGAIPARLPSPRPAHPQTETHGKAAQSGAYFSAAVRVHPGAP